jgi:hypothetical protein
LSSCYISFVSLQCILSGFVRSALDRLESSAAPNQDLENPLGVGGLKVFDWFFPTRTFQRMHVQEDGETGVVGLGDLNGDGNLDIVLVKGRHWPLMSRALLGDGRGRFPTAYNLGDLPYRSYSGRLVDIDGDGDLDVVLIGSLATSVRHHYYHAGKFEWMPR